MLCSISAAKPNSGWLDRLRSAKGFPASPDLENLDQFLSSNPNSTPDPVPEPPPPPRAANEKPHTLFDIMSNVLSDLFVMGPTRANPPKSSRKQKNPRICTGDGPPAAGGSRERSPSSVNNSVAEGKKRKLKVRKSAVEGCAKDWDLSGFSRTEVTVIDTSLSPDWKAARVLYRKGLVWRVREKKVVRVGRKKRRRVGSAEKQGNADERKEKGNVGEAKGSSFHKQQLALLDKAGNTQTEPKGDFKEIDEQALITRRPKFTRSPRTPAKNTSPILRLKIISKKNGATSTKNILKGK